MQPYIIQVLLILLLFVLSAFFSGSETALFSLKKGQLHRFRNSEMDSERTLFDLMKKPSAVLATILSGNLLANIGLSIITTSMFLGVSGKYGEIIAITILTPSIILICEITPKIVVLQNPEYYSRLFAPVMNIFHRILYPFRMVFALFTFPLIRAIRHAEEKNLSVTHREIEMLIEENEKEGNIQPDEAEFIRNVMRFPLKEATNIMIPRNQAVFISQSMTVSEAVDVFRETGIVRAPVYAGNPDEISGLLDVRDLIAHMMNPKEAKKKSISKYVTPVHFFPASKKIGDLLNEFLSKKIQIAVVVDEYGGTAGIVTLSSLIIEIMGKDFTLSDEGKDDDIRDLGKGNYIIHGDYQINDYNATFNENLESTESDTIAGYIIERTGHFPPRNTVIMTESHMLRVRSIRKNRIETIEVRFKENR